MKKSHHASNNLFVNRILTHSFTLWFIFIIFIGLRVYDWDRHTQFTWDQVQNSWVMKNIIVDHIYPLEGMVAKGNSGFFIGPMYYYLLAPFYAIANLDLIAVVLFTTVINIIYFFIYFRIISRLFSPQISTIAMFIYAVSFRAITSDRIAWPVVLIPLVSVGIFYLLYRLINGDGKSAIWLSLLVGFSFHVHFTAIFFPLIILCCIPFFSYNSTSLKYYGLSILLFLIWFTPAYITGYGNHFSSLNRLESYIQTYNHGFHVVRLIQILKEAFIEFEGMLFFPWLRFLHYIFLPLFIGTYLYSSRTLPKLKLIYLTLLWFIVPLFVFTFYSGEISDYYFSMTRPIVVCIFGYITWQVLNSKFKFIAFGMIVFWLFFAYNNIQHFNKIKSPSIYKEKQKVMQLIQNGNTLQYSDGNLQVYLYYLYTRNQSVIHK